MTQDTVKIGDQVHPRIAYGDESGDWGADKQPCRQCRVTRGELHHVGCLVERCPACDGQLMTCQCPYDVTFNRRPISAFRQVFYKAFYLAALPVGLLMIIRKFTGIPLPYWTLAVAPVVLITVFWRKMGPMELSQVIPCPPPDENENSKTG